LILDFVLLLLHYQIFSGSEKQTIVTYGVKYLQQMGLLQFFCTENLDLVFTFPTNSALL